MYIKRLTYLGEGYDIVKPIYVKVAAYVDDGDNLYCITVVNLQNELIFGIGRTLLSAEEMLRELLTNYYENIMSSNLDRYYSQNLFADKEKLKRSIIKK